MGETTISGDAQAVARGAGGAFRAATDTSFGDARSGLKYMLLRLGGMANLTERDREQLTELARLAFQESDVAAQAGRIRDAADASPLAVTIAGLVQESGRTSTKATMLGAIAGAYAALPYLGRASNESAVLAGIVGAIAGATAAATAEFLDGERARDSWRSFLERE